MRTMQCNALARPQGRPGSVPGPKAPRQRRGVPAAASSRPILTVNPNVAGPIQLGPRVEVSDADVAAAIEQASPGATTRRGLLGRAMVLGAGMAACPCCTGEALASGNAKFEYGNLSGPDSWGGTCKAGMRQSPIDIPRKAIRASIQRVTGPGAACKPTQLDAKGYKPVKPKLLNTGVGTMQANFEKGSQTMVCGGADLELVQFHFHTPSEHAFDGERTAMEVHLVHRNRATGGLAVIGVLMEPIGSANPVLTTALKYSPPKAREEIACPATINPLQLLPRQGAWQYVRYSGSLTTPGCSEGVDWYVMLETISVTPDQVLQFAQYVSGGRSFGQNSRPVQPLNGRAFDLQYDCGFV